MCMPGERVLLNGTSRVLKKTTTSVLVAQKPRRTFLYASAFSLPAALLDGLFEHSVGKYF